MQKGEAKIEVTFEVNADGILKVSAREKTSDTEAEITVSGAVKLSEADIVRMTADAEEFAEEDEAAKAVAVNRHRLESEVMDSLYDSEDSKAISHLLSDEDKKVVRKEVTASRTWLNTNGLLSTMEEIDAEWKRFTEAVHPLLEPHRPKPTASGDAFPDEDAPRRRGGGHGGGRDGRAAGRFFRQGEQGRALRRATGARRQGGALGQGEQGVSLLRSATAARDRRPAGHRGPYRSRRAAVVASRCLGGV
ncbi:Hsp70 protein-domain-containing protein [Pavlovales sp. CCMP2436]|nr:Hsp70 protein-domain-containing protein [Pavlovales sp. CCMP2436]